MMFPLVNALPSTCSAEILLPLFAGFSGTMLLSDFRGSFISALQNFSLTDRSFFEGKLTDLPIPVYKMSTHAKFLDSAGSLYSSLSATKRVAFPARVRGRHPKVGDFGAQ